jgi:hypothetical protein
MDKSTVFIGSLGFARSRMHRVRLATMNLEPTNTGDLDRPRSRALEVSFQLHAVTYVVVNVMLIAIWAMVGFGSYFWPMWPIITWGPAVAIHGWITYGRVHGD